MLRLYPALALTSILILEGSCSEPREKTAIDERFPNAPVILISIDTLRADHLPAYGYTGVSTPNIDAFRADSVLFTNAYSHCPLTLPSHVTMLAGTLPFQNGVRDNTGYRLSPDSTGLPRILAPLGYESGAAISAYVLRGETGLRNLFDWYDDSIPFQPGVAAGSIQRAGGATVDSALNWIRARRQKPFFFFLHLFEPHTPYAAPEPFRSASQSPYDGEIAYVDSVAGRFITELKQQGIYDRAIILLLSDHGEGLGDHGEREHGIFLYREALHVPLMVKLPGRRAAGQTVDATVGLIDIAPTIARLLGAAAPSSWSGTPLLGPPRDPRGNRRVYSESIYGRLHLGWSELRSLVDAGHHFIEAPRPELYDLARDPQEKQNILAESRRVYAGFRDEMATFPREVKQPAPATSEEQKKLAALGYLTGSPDSTAASIDPKDGIVDLSLYEEAKEFARQRKYDRAITAYRTLLEKNPRFSDALTQLAALYETTGRYMEAEAAYRELLRQNPASAEHVAIALGVVYMNLRRYAEAESHAALALHSNPGGAHLVIGRVRMAVGDYAGAERHAREATSDVHFRSQAVLLLAESLVKQRKADRALAALDAERSELRVARAAPVRSLELGRGDALIHVGRIAEAEAAFREELKLFPDNRDAYTSLAAVYGLQGRTGEIEPLLEGLVAASPTPGNYATAAKTLDAFGLAAAAGEWRRRGVAAAR